MGDAESTVSRSDMFVFLTGEDVDAGDEEFCMAMLARFRGREFGDLAGTRPVENDMVGFAQGRGLRGVGEG